MTVGARNLLDDYKLEIGFRILHEAERIILEEESRREIGEGDILEAKKRVFRASTSSRKWAMRFATTLLPALLALQLSTFRELPNLGLIFQICMYFPTVASLVWLLCFSYFFRQEWI